MLTYIVEICKIGRWLLVRSCQGERLGGLSSVASEDWTEVNARLMGSTPQAILEWAVGRFGPRLTMATAFGAEGCVLIHLLAEIDAKVRVFNLDTGYQFAETLALRERIRERYGIEVELIRPETTTAEYENQHGGPMYVVASGPVLLRPEDRAAAEGARGYDAWITAIRADQSSHRAAASVVGVDRKFGLVKVNPLLTGVAATFGRLSRRTMCRITRCTIRDMRRLAAGRARARWPTARMSGRAAGRGMPRPSAVCTRLTAVCSKSRAANNFPTESDELRPQSGPRNGGRVSGTIVIPGARSPWLFTLAPFRGQHPKPVGRFKFRCYFWPIPERRAHARQAVCHLKRIMCPCGFLRSRSMLVWRCLPWRCGGVKRLRCGFEKFPMRTGFLSDTWFKSCFN